MKKNRIIEIDGSMGEGGGQILRSAISIASVLGIPIRIYNIRAKRKNPGLRPQHLTAVKALAEITNARVKGAYVGSMDLVFEPKTIKGGSYKFDVGTAGSVSLVLQALLPVLAFAPKRVEVEIRGGTDVPMAPTIDYVKYIFLWFLERLGYKVNLTLYRRGHYPRGGGIVKVVIEDPPRGFKSLRLIERGNVKEVNIYSHAVRLPKHVAERQAKAASALIEKNLKVKTKSFLEWYEPSKDPHLGPGSGVLVEAVCENSKLGGDSLGAKGKRAETVGEEAARILLEDLNTGASLDRHMSDMILIYLAFAKGASEFSGAKLTMHAYTMLKLLEIMVEGFEYKLINGELNKPFKITIFSRILEDI
jgi:RNA 3'-terminal phosphate cyclase (ATP)